MSLYVGDRVACIPHGHLHRATYIRGRIDTIDSPDDEHLVARKMYRNGINKYKKKNCASSWLFTKNVNITCHFPDSGQFALWTINWKVLSGDIKREVEIMKPSVQLPI